MDFLTKGDLKLTVLGTEVAVKYQLNPGVIPGHIDMSIPQEPNSPVVRHIYKFANNDTELHLCSPHLQLAEMRPTTFEGPGYVVMRRGDMAVDEGMFVWWYILVQSIYCNILGW